MSDSMLNTQPLTTPVVTRFAPSPTGSLHIGGARTALFNWIFARGHGGTFLLRIEDTDKERSSDKNTQAILDGLRWLGLDWDGEPVFQSQRTERHVEVAQQLLNSGHAYKCFATPDEIDAFKQKAREDKVSILYRSPWRDVVDERHPDLPYTVRIKAPRDGKVTLHDEVQGDVTWSNDQLDDMILLRSDGTPVYMLAVVVDDHDMGVTHVVRGDDHLANAFRQNMIYQAMGWAAPVLAHVPLIFGPDGKKLSKRHGATGASEYQGMGYPTAGMRNYLARLGWSHEDHEFFTDEQAQAWFELDGIGKSPARFDFKKLEHVCGQHIAAGRDHDLLREITAYWNLTHDEALNAKQQAGLEAAMYCLKDRAKTFPDLLDKAAFVLNERPLSYDARASKALSDDITIPLCELTSRLESATWERDELEKIVTDVAQNHGTKLGKLAAPLRGVLSGRSVSPSIFDMMLVLGRDETKLRLEDAIAHMK